MTERRRATTATAMERRLLRVIGVLCGTLIAGGLAVPIFLGARGTREALSLGNVSDAQIVEIRDRGGQTLLTGEFRSRIDALGDTEKDAALLDRRGRRVIGEVELEIPADGRTDRRPELEVDVMGLPPRATLLLVIDDRVVATFQTDDRGSFDQEIQEGEVLPQDPF
jgi:hypothetical protein